MRKVKIKELKQIIREEIEKQVQDNLSELNFKTKVPTARMPAGPGAAASVGAVSEDDWFQGDTATQGSLEKKTSLKMLKNNITALKKGVVDISNAKKNFNPSWYGTMCASEKGAILADLTAELVDSVNTVGKALNMTVVVEGITINQIRMIIAEEAQKLGMIDEGMFDWISSKLGMSQPAEKKGFPGIRGIQGVTQSSLRAKHMEMLIPAMKQTLALAEDWLAAYTAFPTARKIACLGRSGSAFAKAVENFANLLNTIV